MTQTDDKLNWPERMKALRAELKRPLTLEEMMEVGRHCSHPQTPGGRTTWVAPRVDRQPEES